MMDIDLVTPPASPRDMSLAASVSPPQPCSAWDSPGRAPADAATTAAIPPLPAEMPGVRVDRLPLPLLSQPQFADGPSAAIAPERSGPPLPPLNDFSAPCWAFLDSIDLLEEFAIDRPTLRVVPRAARTMVASVSEDILAAVLRADRGSAAETRAWKLLPLRERLLFWAPLNLNEGRRTYRETERIDLARLVRTRVGRLLQ